MRFFFYLMIGGQENGGGLPFALLLVEANATIKIIKCMRLHIFRYLSQKALKSFIYREKSNHRRKPM